MFCTVCYAPSQACNKVENRFFISANCLIIKLQVKILSILDKLLWFLNILLSIIYCISTNQESLNLSIPQSLLKIKKIIEFLFSIVFLKITFCAFFQGMQLRIPVIREIKVNQINLWRKNRSLIMSNKELLDRFHFLRKRQVLYKLDCQIDHKDRNPTDKSKKTSIFLSLSNLLFLMREKTHTRHASLCLCV